MDGPFSDAVRVACFSDEVRKVLQDVLNHVVAKNESYGDSALNPIRIFSSADWRAGLYVRIDDKLSRVRSQQEWPGDDTILDLIGYLVLLRIGRAREVRE